MEKIGLFGGTFNPLHFGHIKIAEAFIKELELTKCVFIPANISPFKTDAGSQTTVEATHRLNMLKLGLEEYLDLEFDDFEIRSGGISYTYLTLEHYKSIHPDSELHWLIGGDHIGKFNQWRNYEHILEMAELVVVNRNNELSEDDIRILNDLTKGNFRIIDIPLIHISATDIRERIHQGISIEDIVPVIVVEYIKINKLYR